MMQEISRLLKCIFCIFLITCSTLSFKESRSSSDLLVEKTLYSNRNDFQAKNKWTMTSNYGQRRVRRDTRNLYEILKDFALVDPYTMMKLIWYGNFCGIDGNGHDGRNGTRNYVDACDLCCRDHDDCYDRLQEQKCDEGFSVYNNSYKADATRDKKDICDLDQADCPIALCECDVVFANCLFEARVDKKCPELFKS